MNIFNSAMPRIVVHLPPDIELAQMTAVAASDPGAAGGFAGLTITDPTGKELELNGTESAADIARKVRASLGGDATVVDYLGFADIAQAHAGLNKLAEKLKRNLLVNFHGVTVPFDRFTECEDFGQRIIDALKLRKLSNGAQLITAPVNANRGQTEELALSISATLRCAVVFSFFHPRGRVRDAFWVAAPESGPGRIKLLRRSLREEAAAILRRSVT